MNRRRIEILIVVIAFSVLALTHEWWFESKDKAEVRAKSIYDQELTADEVARIYKDPFYEPNDGDVLIPTPSGDYIWVADEPYEPEQSR